MRLSHRKTVPAHPCQQPSIVRLPGRGGGKGPDDKLCPRAPNCSATPLTIQLQTDWVTIYCGTRCSQQGITTETDGIHYALRIGRRANATTQYTCEIIPELYENTGHIFTQINYKNTHKHALLCVTSGDTRKRKRIARDALLIFCCLFVYSPATANITRITTIFTLAKLGRVFRGPKIWTGRKSTFMAVPLTTFVGACRRFPIV